LKSRIGNTPIPDAKDMNEAMMAAVYHADALKKAELLIVLLSPKAAQDEMVEDDVNYALKHNIPIMPILIEPTPVNLIRPALQRLKAIDASQDYPQTIRMILKNLEGVAGADAYTLAQKFFRLGLKLNDNSDEELRAYSKAIELYPQFAAVYNNRAHIYSLRQQLDLALTDCEKALTLDGENAVFRLQRAGVLRRMQRYPEALLDCNRVLKKNPEYQDAWINRGNIYKDMKDFKQALEDYSQAIALDASNCLIYHNRAAVFKELGKLYDAERDYLKVIELQPNWAEGYRKLGLFYHTMGKHKRAVEMGKLALEKDLKHPDARQMRDYIRQYS
jgi:tetratricopeptide (TPR) repeat protein